MKNESAKAAWRVTHYQLAETNGKLIINLRDVGHMMRGLYEGRGSQQRVLIVLHEMRLCHAANADRTAANPIGICQRGDRKIGKRGVYR